MISQNKKSKDTVTILPKIDRYGLRIGVDLFKLSRSLYDKNYKGLELVGDFRVTKKHYLAAEIGNENKTTNENQLNFTTKGTYLKVGFDYNAHQNWLNLENMIYIGLRFGISSFNQEINNYKVYNSDPFFNEPNTVVVNQKFDGLSAKWGEVVAGIKTKVFDNVFVGFSLRGSNLFSNKKPNGFDNLYIPGFNRTYNGNFGVGFNYTVSYFLPVYKKKNLPKIKLKKN
jgi:hypothetical protein